MEKHLLRKYVTVVKSAQLRCPCNVVSPWPSGGRHFTNRRLCFNPAEFKDFVLLSLVWLGYSRLKK